MLTMSWILLALLIHQQEVSGRGSGNINQLDILMHSESSASIEKNYTVPLGSTFNIGCSKTTENDAPFLTWHFDRGFKGSSKAIATCSLNQDCTRQRTLHNVQVSYEKLTISSIEVKNSGMYMCEQFTTTGKKVKLYANIIAGAPPGRPKIQLEDSSIFTSRKHLDFVEGDVIVLQCETSGGYPKASFRWANELFQDIPSDEITHSNNDLYGKSVSKLRMKLKAEDNYSKIKCFVGNSISEKEFDATFNINVRYKPKIDLSYETNHWIIVVNEPTLIECKVNAYPTATVQWKDADGNIVSTDSILSLGKDETSRAILERANQSLITKDTTSMSQTLLKSYTCSASSSQGETTKDIQVKFSHSPLVKVPSRIEIDEGSNLETVKCEVRADPRPHHVTWTKIDSNGIKVDVWNSSLLRLDNVGVGMAGRYRCEAENRIQATGKKLESYKSYDEMELVVKYKPRKPILQISSSEEIKVGESVQISCLPNEFKPGFPRPKFRLLRSKPGLLPDSQVVKQFIEDPKENSHDGWERLRAFREESFSIDNLSLTDEAVYFCAAENEQGITVSEPFNLDVKSPLKWVEKPSDLSLNLITETAKDIKIDCSVQSDSMPKIVWTYNREELIVFDFDRETDIKLNENKDIRINIQNDIVINEVDIKLVTIENRLSKSPRKSLIWQVKSTLKWPKGGIKPGSEGNYSCIIKDARNEKESLQQKFQIKLDYPILLFPGHEEIQSFDPTKHEADLKCYFLSPTEPKALGFHQDGNILATYSENIHLQKMTKYGIDVWMMRVTITRVYSSMKGSQFACLAKNDYGEAKGFIKLIEAGPPTKIEDLHVGRISWDCCDLTWKRNYNGGFPQTFTIVYEAKKSSSYAKEFNFTENEAKFLPSFNSMKYQFCGLASDEEYSVRVYSQNDLGKSQSSKFVDFKTKKPDLPMHIIYQYLRGNKELKVYPPKLNSRHCVLIEYSRNDGENWDKIQRVCSSDVERMIMKKATIFHRSAGEIYQERLFRSNYPSSGNFERKMQQDDLANPKGDPDFLPMNDASQSGSSNHYVIVKNPSEDNSKQSQLYRLRNCLVDRPHICNKAYIINLKDAKDGDVTTSMMAIVILVSTFCLLVFIVLSLVIMIRVKHKKSANNSIRMKNLPKNMNHCISKDYPSLLNNTETSMPSRHIPSPATSSKYGNSLRAASTMNTLTSTNNGNNNSEGSTQNIRFWGENGQNGQMMSSSFQNVNHHGSDSTMSLLPLGPPKQNINESKGLWQMQDHIFLEQNHGQQQQQNFSVYSPMPQPIYSKDQTLYIDSPSISGESGKENQRNGQSYYSTSLQRMPTINSPNLQVYFPVNGNQDVHLATSNGNLEPAFITTVQLSNDVPVELITVDSQSDAANMFFQQNPDAQNDLPIDRYVIPRSYCRL